MPTHAVNNSGKIDATGAGNDGPDATRQVVNVHVDLGTLAKGAGLALPSEPAAKRQRLAHPAETKTKSRHRAKTKETRGGVKSGSARKSTAKASSKKTDLRWQESRYREPQSKACQEGGHTPAQVLTRRCSKLSGSHATG